MKSNVILFVAGVVVGIGALLGALALVPNIIPAAQPQKITLYSPQMEKAMIRFFEKMTMMTEEVLVAPSVEAREAALTSNLQSMRIQLELYKIQHLEKSPHLDENGKLDTANFVARLTSKTDINGKISPSGEYGPYLSMFPNNPFIEENSDRVAFGTQNPPPGDGKTGWYFNTNTLMFSANDTDHVGL